MSELLSPDLLPKSRLFSRVFSKVRLFIEANANEAWIINTKLEIANNDFDYLIKVMRQKIGDQIIIFDGANGDFVARILEIKKKSLILEIVEKIAEFRPVPNIKLAFAPVKNVRIDFVASKACELGVKAFQPIITQRTIVDKINHERFLANIKEASEQCGRNDLPIFLPIKKLENLFKDGFEDKIIILCDESGCGARASELLPKIKLNPNQEIIIFIGPEGGFSEDEFNKFRNLTNCYALNLGPRILRSDTAIITALTLVQEFLGDFNQKAKFV